jgi:hypothetical protein
MRNKILILVVCAAIVFGASILVFASDNINDPAITMSFFENNLIPRIAAMIEARLAGADIDDPNVSFNQNFEVVSVEAGQRLIGEAGTEFILRAGAANIIASELGGISDVTDGVDLENTVPVPQNHLLIVPRSDGRGLNVTSFSYIMVRGQYSIR